MPKKWNSLRSMSLKCAGVLAVALLATARPAAAQVPDGAVVAATIIDAANQGITVTCDSNEGPDSVLDGFTITSGTGTDPGDGVLQGGGMYVLQGSPTVTHAR